MPPAPPLARTRACVRLILQIKEGVACICETNTDTHPHAMAEVVVQHQDLLQVQEIVGDSVPDPTSAVVGGETRASSGAGNGLLVADGSGEEGVRNDRAAASCLAPQVVEKEGNEKANQEGEGRLRRSLSPEYVDAVQDPELQQNTMGETATRKDTDEARIYILLMSEFVCVLA